MKILYSIRDQEDYSDILESHNITDADVCKALDDFHVNIKDARRVFRESMGKPSSAAYDLCVYAPIKDSDTWEQFYDFESRYGSFKNAACGAVPLPKRVEENMPVWNSAGVAGVCRVPQSFYLQDVFRNKLKKPMNTLSDYCKVKEGAEVLVIIDNKGIEIKGGACHIASDFSFGNSLGSGRDFKKCYDARSKIVSSKWLDNDNAMYRPKLLGENSFVFRSVKK